MTELQQVLKDALMQEDCGWNMGSFGAIAEFHHVYGDPAPQEHAGLMQVTPRGGVRIDNLEGVRPIAYETLSPKPHRWTQAVSLCLPHDAAAMNQRGALTALGPDEDALRDEDRGALLFDMGLGQYQADFCIRTADPELLETEIPAEDAVEPDTREGRAGWRNGIRQWRVLHGPNRLTEAYAERFDRGTEQTDPENPGH
ncbi:DUF6925 family protein [Phaeobacter inhibens]|uniref:DUF6925 family protein n=1 Tax=Phaeobacter inhibens TaxID=221822 RepID=UPI0021A4E2AC|nr:hypothetical protein [Phaeobacter inhibens]UWR90500.1 hypothetical protein K4L01_18170 [Phaeobacter inhibens]